MKALIIVFMTAITMTFSSNAQTERAHIEQTINQFVKATSERDVYGMHYLLHETFQDAEFTGVRSKSDYMKLLADRKLGGEDQKAEILSVDIAQGSASIRVKICGNSGSTESYMHLVKNDYGSWQILHILPCLHQKV